MKNLNMLVWLTQLGLSVAVMPTLIVLLAVYLQERLQCGSWIFWVGAALALWMGISGFISSMRTMQRLSEGRKEDLPPVSFNDHV